MESRKGVRDALLHLCWLLENDMLPLKSRSFSKHCWCIAVSEVFLQAVMWCAKWLLEGWKQPMSVARSQALN